MLELVCRHICTLPRPCSEWGSPPTTSCTTNLSWRQKSTCRFDTGHLLPVPTPSTAFILLFSVSRRSTGCGWPNSVPCFIQSKRPASPAARAERSPWSTWRQWSGKWSRQRKNFNVAGSNFRRKKRRKGWKVSSPPPGWVVQKLHAGPHKDLESRRFFIRRNSCFLRYLKFVLDSIWKKSKRYF